MGNDSVNPCTRAYRRKRSLKNIKTINSRFRIKIICFELFCNLSCPCYNWLSLSQHPMKKVIFLFLITLNFSVGFGQTPSDSVDIYLIETTDGNQYIGRILDRNSNYIRMQTEQLGEIRIKAGDIRKLEMIRRDFLAGEEFWLENPQATRYYWSANGYGLRKGEGYYQNAWVFFNQFSVGLSDNISIGGGLMPLFLLGGTPTPVWISPKISIPISRDKFNLGTGVLLGTVIGEQNATFGLIYGITTFGSRDKNLSIGMGYGLLDGQFSELPAISLSTMIRTGRRGYFISENYLIPSDPTVYLISVGGRSVLPKIGIDYGLFIPLYNDLETLFAVPWLGITVPFGKKKN